jgi:hypothetical protein
MKMHTRNLIFASLVYAAVLFGLVLFPLLGDSGFTFYDYELEEITSDAVDVSLTALLAVLAAFAVYMAYYVFNRIRVKKDPSIKYLSAFTRCLIAVAASLAAAAVVFIMLNYIASYGDEEALFASDVALPGIMIAVITVANFVNCVVFKPRT